jgi:hypothetical protein
MILSVHQPNFAPWCGFFNKLASSDVFIILDTAQYPRGKSVANRNTIKSSQGAQEIVVPITTPKGMEGKASYQEVNFAEANWHKKILKTLEMNYGKSLYYKEYYSYISDLYKSATSFSDMNIRFIKDVVSDLNITNRIYYLSEISNSLEGCKNELIINLCLYFNAKTYLSGTGAKAYNDEALYKQHNICLEYQDFTPKPYPQLYGEYIPNLSIIDLLMNTGKNAINYII